MTVIKNSDAERLARKIRTLMEQGDFLHLLFEGSPIKDEFLHMSKIGNEKLEYYVDKALNNY